MVGVATVLVAPDSHVEARGCDGAEAELEHESALAGQRVLGKDLVGRDESVGPADADVASAVDDEARVAAQPLGDEVCREALAGAAGVEAKPRGPGDRARGIVDLDVAPLLGRARARRVSRWRLGQRGTQRRPRNSRPRGDVAGGFDLPDQGWVDQPTAALRRLEPGFDRHAQQLRCWDALAGVGVECAELALGLEARQRRVELDDQLARLLGGSRCRSHAQPRLADQQPYVRTHCIEDDVVFTHNQEAPVVTGV